MEKGDNRRSRYSISDSKSLLSDDYSSLMNLHSTEGFPCRGFDGGGGGGAGGGGWPTGSNRGGANEVVGYMYCNSVSSSCLGAENFSTTTNSQPFDIFAAPYSYESPGRGMAAASVAFPFTSAQWRELERQAMIYKYMMSSLPVPPDLLFPLSRNCPPSVSSLYNVRYSKDGDPEPGRCKRTDGKKWRCSRDVAPHQKYCERHLHRGRPRSRKPVEPIKNSDKKAPIDQTNLQEQHLAAAAVAANDKPLLHFDPKTDLNISNTPCDRDLGLMDGAEKQWQFFTQTNMGSANEGRPMYGSDSPFHQDYVEQNPMTVSSYSKFPAFEAPTYFTDAYSSNNGNGSVHSSISTKPDNLSPSLNLSISMASGTSSGQEMAKLNCCDEQSMKDSRWLSPVSWEPSGGPLAEALGCKNRASAQTSISPVATTVSSPTGVLHGTLFSHSAGSSVCNSPTSEVAFRWLN